MACSVGSSRGFRSRSSRERRVLSDLGKENQIAELPHVSQEPSRATLESLVELFKANRHVELEAAATRVLAQYPQSVGLLHLLGVSRLSRNLIAEAIEALLRAQRLAPAEPEILNLLGLALSRLGRHEEARARFDASLELDPKRYETLVNASAAALAAGDAPAARQYAARALEVQPQGIGALLNLGNALAASGRNGEAVDIYRRAIVLSPRIADLHLNLGHALTGIGRYEEAAIALRQALELRPDYAPAHLNLGRALHELGDTGGAQRHFRTASELDPRLVEAHSAYLFSLAHDADVSPGHAFAEHLRIGDLMEAPYRAAWRAHENDRDPDRILRLGFVSADLHDHPVANLIEPVWRAMRGGPFRLHVYANGSWGDAVEARLRTLAHEWMHVERMSDDALSERIRADRIDILFDLSGHTAGHRLPVFARKPAPVQVSWIGYPGTTGLSAIDYRFMRAPDGKADDLAATFREKLVFFRARGFEPAPDAPEVNALPALRNGALTFGSFNRPSKLGENVVALWSRVLLAIPDARLLIAGVNESGLQERLLAEFVRHGIAARRLTFRPRVPVPEYLAMHHEVDIALDTFPYTGGTTTLHALWMGVPVLTLVGSALLQQRQAAAVLGLVGLSDWVTESEDAFVARACAAATDLPALSRLRAALRGAAERRYRDVSGQAAREMENALRRIWRRWCAGEEPESFIAEA